MTSQDIQQEIEAWRGCDESRLQNLRRASLEWYGQRSERTISNNPNSAVKPNVMRLLRKYLYASPEGKTRPLDAATLTALWENANNRLVLCESKSSTPWMEHDSFEVPDFIREFNERADRWRRDTSFQSSLAAKFLHEDYQIIMAMGPRVVPLILNRLKTEHEEWFWALKHLAGGIDAAKTCDNPVDAVKAWLNWGRKKGYID